MNSKPFCVNLNFLPTVTPPVCPGLVDAIIKGGIKIVETAGNPQKWLPALKENGITVIKKCTSVRHAHKAETIACSAVSIDGYECGGLRGEEDRQSVVWGTSVAERVETCGVRT